MIQAALKDLGLLAKKRRIVFVVLVISVTCSFLVMSLMTGVVKHLIRSASMGSAWNTFTVEYPEGVSADDLAEGYEVLMRESSPSTVFAASFDGSASAVVLGWYGENENRWFTQDEGRFLDDSDVESAARVAVVSEKLYPAFEFEEFAHPVQVAGTDVNIIGVGMLPTGALFTGDAFDAFRRYAEPEGDRKIAHVHDEPEATNDKEITGTIILPISTFIDLNLTANLIRVEYSVTSERILALYHSFLESVFPGAQITDPVIAETFYSDSMKVAISRSVGLIIFAFINIAALYVYWLLMMRRTHTLYMACGASKSTIITMILLEWFILTLLGYMLFILVQGFSAPVLNFMRIEPISTAVEQAICFAFIYLTSTSLMVRQVIKNAQIHSEVI